MFHLKEKKGWTKGGLKERRSKKKRTRWVPYRAPERGGEGEERQKKGVVEAFVEKKSLTRGDWGGDEALGKY